MNEPTARRTADDPLTDNPSAAMDRTRDFARKILAIPRSEIPKYTPKRRRQRKRSRR